MIPVIPESPGCLPARAYLKRRTCASNSTNRISSFRAAVQAAADVRGTSSIYTMRARVARGSGLLNHIECGGTWQVVYPASSGVGISDVCFHSHSPSGLIKIEDMDPRSRVMDVPSKLGEYMLQGWVRTGTTDQLDAVVCEELTCSCPSGPYR
jgi:hypothetical protein